jgi:hypothetical protein
MRPFKTHLYLAIIVWIDIIESPCSWIAIHGHDKGVVPPAGKTSNTFISIHLHFRGCSVRCLLFEHRRPPLLKPGSHCGVTGTLAIVEASLHWIQHPLNLFVFENRNPPLTSSYRVESCWTKIISNGRFLALRLLD